MKAQFKILVQALGFAFIGLCGLFAAEEPSDKRVHPLDGSWRWNFTMPDGSTSRPKLVLAVEDGKLTGSVKFRPSTESRITNAVLKGSQIRFQIVRERDGQLIVTTYSGKWTDQVIKGTIESNWAGEKQTYDWEAKRAHIGAEGTWKWQASFGGGGRPFTVQVDLEQDGEILTGTMPFRFGRGGRGSKLDVKNGSIKDGEVYFEIERGTDENKTVTIYRGKQIGDTIEGTIERTTTEGEQVKDEWYAKRAD